MKFIRFLLPFLLSIPLGCFAQGVYKWRVIFTYSQTNVSTRKSPIRDDKYNFTMNGNVNMLISGEPSFDNGHVIITTPQDSLVTFTVHGNVTSRTDDKILAPNIGIMETRTDQYNGEADQSEQGLEFEYDPKGAKYINAGIRFNKKGNYHMDVFHRGGDQPDQHFDFTDNQDYGTYTASIGSEKDIIKAVKNGFTIDGQYTEKDTTSSYPDEVYSSIKTTQYHVTIMKELDYNIFIVPVNEAAYKKWLPLGPSLTGDADRGNDIAVKIILVNKRTGATIPGDFSSEWNLKSSMEPGYCMNFPDEKKADKKRDLRFDQSAEAKTDFQTITENKAISKNGKGGSPINIISYDYGGYANITATITLSDGTVMPAISKLTNSPVFTIPQDDNNNHIADEWERQENVFEKNYAADWDEDYLPEGIGDHNGDGLTLYEEYRGFCENKKHIRTSAKTKDLMICDMIEGRSKDGIAIFKEVSKINVHDAFQLDEFGRESKDMELEGLPKDKCINFNFTAETHSVDQHGIALVKSLEKKGYAQAVLKDKDTLIGTPKHYKYLEITLDFDPGPAGYNVVRGVIGKGDSVSSDPMAKAKIISDEYAITVAHEILHCCNVKHHGEYDRKVTLLLGKDAKKLAADPNFNPDPNGFCIIDRKENIIKAIILYSSATELSINPNPLLPAEGIEMYLGMQHGQHSGVEDCIMRYDAARMFLDAAGNYFLLDAGGAGYNNELAGVTLCSSGIGTGVNASDHKPRPRYGDADTERGNCKHQFCINDKYH